MDEREEKDENESESESESESQKATKRRRRLLGNQQEEPSSRKRLLINQQDEPSSPDHTYKTSDEEYCSDQERECDIVLDNMLPCRGAAELLPSDDERSGVDQNLEGLVRVKGMSARETFMSKNYQENIADRVKTYVKKHLFRVVMFISNKDMFAQAFTMVMDHECVANRDRVKFQMLYESVFNHALNSKRSTCEQAGGNIMLKELKRFKEEGVDMFLIDKLQNLRRANTEREKQAFLWFFGSFLECVSGLKHWGVQKSKQLVSQASSSATKHGKLVTISDEAFALLLYDNYIEKWVKTFQQEEQQRLEALALPQPACK